MIYTAIQILNHAKNEKLAAIKKWEFDETMQSIIEILQRQVNEIDLAINILEQQER